MTNNQLRYVQIPMGAYEAMLEAIRRKETGTAQAPVNRCKAISSEPLYQWRKVGEKGWLDCKKEWFDMSNKEQDKETRVLYLTSSKVPVKINN
ncbi:hypothetical protein FHD02_05120 [Citrobacter sp. EC_71]|uniref:hypothetical protein n=1 Tax=unclassified Citrobacter TaxID=2644389 RepID=UPI0010C992E7|nr:MULTISPECIES: hypothetical protein [unclassified Citrobacter]MBW9350980.1 hypothetical protein [Citrobacter sp. EC_71]TKV15626.1 hypothetical protein FDX04_08180 [Citrobacter sp. wls615]